MKENTRGQTEAMFLSHQGHLFWVLTGLGSMPNHFLSVKKNIKISTNLFKSCFYEPKAEISKLWPMGQIQPVVVNKLLLEHSHHVYLYYLWLPLSYYSQNSDLMAKPKIFPIWLFVEKVCQPPCPPRPNLKHS